jgi:TolB-like protein/Flp pilus assembly protein TadD
MFDTVAGIFISHASADRRIAETLCMALESRGLKCWIARRDVAPGENFQTAIVRAIRRSKIMLLVFTASANNSDEVKKELALASQSKLMVIPLRAEDVIPGDAFAFELVTRHWVDLLEDWEHAVEQLVARLKMSLAGDEDNFVETPDGFAGAQHPVEPATERTATPPRQAIGRRSDGSSSGPNDAPQQELAAPATDRPMVVVLPFENIGSDAEQGYFAEGLAADLVTDLSRFQDLHIVGAQRRLSRSTSPGGTSAEWVLPNGTAYVCRGSVRRAGGRVRVTVQLYDARTGVTLWAERVDRPLDDLFSVQEELAERLPAHLAARVTREGTQRARRRPPARLDAYDLCLQGRELHLRATEADTLAARQMFARAIDLDPHYATAYAWQAYTMQRGFTLLWGETRGRPAAALALELARHGVELEPESSICLARLAFVLLLNAGWEEALASGRASVIANPCAPEARHSYGEVLVHAGDPVAGEREIRLAISLDPFHPPSWRALLGRALLLAGRPEEALPELRWCAARLPDYGFCHQVLAAAAAETGRLEEARAAVRALLNINPGLSVRTITDTLYFRDPVVLKRFQEGFRAGGMVEE